MLTTWLIQGAHVPKKTHMRLLSPRLPLRVELHVEAEGYRKIHQTEKEPVCASASFALSGVTCQRKRPDAQPSKVSTTPIESSRDSQGIGSVSTPASSSSADANACVHGVEGWAREDVSAPEHAAARVARAWYRSSVERAT